MIVPSMSGKEIYEALYSDSYKIKIRIEKMMPKAVKYFKKSFSFPAWYVDEYRIPATNNQYVLFFYASNSSEIEQPNCVSFCILFVGKQRFVIKGKQVRYKHTHKSETVQLPEIDFYTSHFFQRYNERFLHKNNLAVNQIAGLFFNRNYDMLPINLNEKIKKNYKEYGGHNILGMNVNDGFCYSYTDLESEPSEDGIREKDKLEAVINIFTTFVSNANMSPTQKEAIEKESYEVWKRCVDEYGKKI